MSDKKETFYYEPEAPQCICESRQWEPSLEILAFYIHSVLDIKQEERTVFTQCESERFYLKQYFFRLNQRKRTFYHDAVVVFLPLSSKLSSIVRLSFISESIQRWTIHLSLFSLNVLSWLAWFHIQNCTSRFIVLYSVEEE